MIETARTKARGAWDRMVKAWTCPKGRRICARDPNAGPGSCGLWWEGCPKGEARGCFQVHMKAWADGPRRGGTS